MAATKEEYNAKLQQELGRIGTTRDEAVRRTNQALGYGNSTALQYDVPDDLPAKGTPPPPHAKPHKKGKK